MRLSVRLFSNASMLKLCLRFLVGHMALFMDQPKHKNVWTVASEQCFTFLKIFYYSVFSNKFSVFSK